MACRVGMTTNPGERKRYWESKHPNMYNWEILERHKSKSAAQAAEDRIARQYGCVSAAGGDGPESGDWVIYRFQY